MFDKAAYNKKYYHDKVKPFREVKQPRYRYNCPICGHRVADIKAFERTHELNMLVQFGSKYYALDTFRGQEGYTILKSKLVDFAEHMAEKCLRLLRSFRDAGFISQDKIDSIMGSVKVTAAIPVSFGFPIPINVSSRIQSVFPVKVVIENGKR